jgi:urease accessory protein
MGMGWRAALELGFASVGGATLIDRRVHSGPLQIQRPFYPEGPRGPEGNGREVCHVYLLHPPGGMVGGDELRIDVAVGAGAHALVTTPAAGKAYRTTGASVTQTQTLTVADGGALEWLPQETIVYDGARAVLETRIDLATGARFVGAETICFGLPARKEAFAHGSCRQRFDVRRGGRPLFVERGRFDGGGPVHGARWGLGGATVMSLVVASPAPPEAVIDEIRAAAPTDGDGLAGATVLSDGVMGGGAHSALVCRYVGRSAERARAFLQTIWHLIRPAVFGRAAVAPRIWST